LVLCGSRSYPKRGYLASVISMNYSGGRIATTHHDHTSYVVSTAGEQAMANILPVYLDHIINPLLSDHLVKTQVYHYDSKGEEMGVVYNEMRSKEFVPVGMAYMQMRKMLYRPSSSYPHFSGGYTSEIATLTHEEIVAYHQRFYDPCNITVVLVG
ncbi:hypothetical protein GQ54DRAFT_237574, partial [Martensiomyces pterosporus]